MDEKTTTERRSGGKKRSKQQFGIKPVTCVGITIQNRTNAIDHHAIRLAFVFSINIESEKHTCDNQLLCFGTLEWTANEFFEGGNFNKIQSGEQNTDAFLGQSDDNIHRM